MRKKITVTTGSRSEYGLLRPLLKEINQSKKLKLYLIVTGTHLSKKHGLTIKDIQKDRFKIFAKVDMMPHKDTGSAMAMSLGQGIIKFTKIFQNIRPDINLILGDRDEMFASAIAAYHMNIPNAHIHGGDVSGGIDEYTRHAVTKISNIHFTATKKSKERIIKMGENPNYVFCTGSPSIDELNKEMITSKLTLEKEYGITLDKNTILLVQHPVTTQIKLSKKQILSTLDAIVELQYNTIAIAPNSDAGNKSIFELLQNYSKKYSFIKMVRSLPRRDYLGFLQNCGVLVGNSSSGIIEASFLGTPVVNLGIRQLDRERGPNVIQVQDFNKKTIKKSILMALRKKPKQVTIYGKGNAGKKIVKILESISLNKDLIEKKLNY